jgi:D-3-phosphoglycerate dehydrogenase
MTLTSSRSKMGRMPKALLLENIHPFAAQSLREHGFEVETKPGALGEDELIEALDGVDLLGIRSKTTVSAKVIDARPQLTAVGCFCIGTNQVDLEHAGSRGIGVFNAPYSNTRSVVELVICDIICLLRRIPAHTHHMRHGLWDKSATGSHEVRGKTLGIVGYGHIGSQLSVLAEALGMRVVFYDIEEKLAMGNAQRMPNLKSLLEVSDAVTLHVDGRKSNTGFFGEDQFSQMKQDAIFINISRGFVADLGALKQHLDSGHLSGAAVDVFPIEPKKSGDPFVTALADEDNMILTPHIGGSTLEAQEDIGHFVTQRLQDYWFHGSTMLSVNLPQITLKACASGARITHLHANLPGVLADVNQVLRKADINVTAQSLGTEGQLGYVVTDVSTKPDAASLESLRTINGTIRMRVIS